MKIDWITVAAKSGAVPRRRGIPKSGPVTTTRITPPAPPLDKRTIVRVCFIPTAPLSLNRLLELGKSVDSVRTAADPKLHVSLPEVTTRSDGAYCVTMRADRGIDTLSNALQTTIKSFCKGKCDFVAA